MRAVAGAGTRTSAAADRWRMVEAWRAVHEQALAPGDPVAVERQTGRGKLLARERIDQLLDAGSFRELRMLATTAPAPLLTGRSAHGDGIVAGWGTIDGRRVFVFAHDPTVIGGSLGEVGGAKIHRLMDLALDAGAPVIGINDGGGARIQEGVASLVAFGGIFFRNVRASGIVPQISLIMGTATGGAVYSPALTDFVVMVDGTATMAITGPKVVKAVNGEDVTLEDLGGASVHATRSGVAHFVAPDEKACLEIARRLLGFLPQNHLERPPVGPARAPAAASTDPLDLIPLALDAPYDVRRPLGAVVDGGEVLEYAARWAPNVVCGFARLQGHPVGVVANQPAVRAGRLDVAACEKAARFVRTCDAFNLPIVTLVDSPGLDDAPPTTATNAPRDGNRTAGDEATCGHAADQATVGDSGARGGRRKPTKQLAGVRAGAKLAFAFAEATVPRIHVLVGRSGEAAIAGLGATPAVSDLCLAWPTADLALAAATEGVVDLVIEPGDTRSALVDALAVLVDRQPAPVPRKHDNLPL